MIASKSGKKLQYWPRLICCTKFFECPAINNMNEANRVKANESQKELTKESL